MRSSLSLSLSLSYFEVYSTKEYIIYSPLPSSLDNQTYSMFGNENNPGITTRAVFALFDKVKESKFSQFLIRGSFIELYNEEVMDLLANKETGEGHPSRLRIQEDAKTGPFVKGAVFFSKMKTRNCSLSDVFL